MAAIQTLQGYPLISTNAHLPNNLTDQPHTDLFTVNRDRHDLPGLKVDHP